MKLFKKLQAFVLILLLNIQILPVFGASQDYTPVRAGISSELNQGVGNSIEFNRYHDQPHLAQIRGWLPWSINGNARYAAIRARGVGNYDDERDFVTAALNYGPAYAYGNGNRIYKHTLNGLQNGNTIRLFTYVHNNATQGCGGINVARNTKVTFDWSNPRKVVSTIESSNSTPQVISDIVDLGFSGNYTLQYLNQTVVAQKRFPDQYPVGHPSYGTCSNGTDMSWDSPNVAATTVNNHKISINLGNVPGSAGNARWVVSYFRVIPANPSIIIDKDDSTPGTVDIDGNDTQTINAGGTATFRIRVTNNGNIGLKNVSITDSLAPNCNLNITQALPKIQAIGNNNNIFDPNETFTYTCTDTNVISGYTNIATTQATSVSDNITIVRSTDPTVIVVRSNPSILINKDDSTPGTVDTDGNDSQTINTGGTATFTIKVTNNGDVGLNNVSVTDALAPNCNLNITQALPKIQAIGNNNNIFDPNETFTYTCTDTNITAGYTNTAITNGNSVINNQAVTASDPTIIRVGTPSILINKDDSTPGTVDTDGNDTQTVIIGGTAIFTIKVTNNGTAGLENVLVNDPLKPQCALTIAQALPKIQAIGNNDTVFDSNESFTYTCTDTNVTSGYTNTADTQGRSVLDHTTLVVDNDPTIVILNTNPSIIIDKDDSTPGTVDTDGNDTQTIATGGTATFTIKVTNNGNVGLNNISVTDILAPNCSLSTAQALPKITAIGNLDNIFDPTESFIYTCNDTGIISSYTNTAITNGNSVVDNQAVTSNDPTIVVVLGNPSIMINKDDSTPGTIDTDGNDTQTVMIGGMATFTITVTNNGAIGLENVLVNDILKPQCALTIAQALPKITAIGNNDTIFDPNESFTYTCSDTNVNSSYTNTADTQGRSILDHTTLVIDNDPTIVILNTTPSILIDKDDSTPGTIDTDGNDSQAVATGGTATFTIKVTNNGNVGLNNISVTDILAPNCSLSAIQALQKITAIGNNDNIFDPTEIFTYTCTDTNVTAGYTNTAITNGNSIVDNQAVTDNDPTIIVLNDPSILIDKDDSTPGNPDTDGLDTQTIIIGGNANFTIKVTNNGNVGLENVSVTDTLAPNCALDIATALPKIQAIGNNDIIFDPNETFTYTCTDTNVLTGYTNTAATTGTSIIDHTTIVNASDPTVIIVQNNPSILINKDDSTPGTIDTDGNDTQTIVTNGTANFTITVTNNGNVGLENVSVTDTLAPNCALDIATALPKIQAIGNNDIIFDPNESFTYSCTDINVTADYINTAATTGISVIDHITTVNANDPTTIIVQTNPSILINKDDSTPGNADTDGNDTQTVPTAGTATFTITVTNNGNVGLENVSVTDALAPNCTLDIATALTKIQTIGNLDNIFNPLESFTYTCTDTNITAGYINSATTNGISSVDHITPVTSTDTTIVVLKTPSILINKDDSTPGTIDTDGNDTQTISSGGSANFTITVTNNGQVGLNHVIITDTLSPSCNKNDIQTFPIIQSIGNLDNIFDPAETFTYTCTDTNVTAGYTNSVNVDATSIINNIIHVNSTDITEIILSTGTTSSILINKNDADNLDDTQQVTLGGTATFTITVTNNGQKDLNNILVTDTLSPNCDLTATETITKIQAIGNNDTIFNIGESFTYTCTQPNVTSAFTNIATTEGTPTTGGTPVTNSDTTVVTLPTTTVTGGGGPDSIPAIPACLKNERTGSFQCTNIRPSSSYSNGQRNDVEYRYCKQNYNTSEFANLRFDNPGGSINKNCVIYWLEQRNMNRCNNNSQCEAVVNRPPVPTAPTSIAQACINVEEPCPSCLKNTVTVNKFIKNGKQSVAKGDIVDYKINISGMIISDSNNVEITGGHLKVYDMTVPSDSGNIWITEGIQNINNPDNYRNKGFNFIQDGPTSYFQKTLNPQDIADLNHSGLNIGFEYQMNTALAFTTDASQIKNVAFAVLEYDYKERSVDGDGNIIWINSATKKRIGLGEKVCANNQPSIKSIFENNTFNNSVSTSSYGSTATIKIIRPFVVAKIGNIAIKTSKVENFSHRGKTTTYGGSFLANNGNPFDDKTDNDNSGLIDELREYQELEANNFYENLNENAKATATFGTVDFETHDYASGVYFTSEDVTIDSNFFNNVTTNSTFILKDGANLYITEDMNINDTQFSAFIIRTGDIVIQSSVKNIEGVFIAEKGMVKSDIPSPEKLTISGNIIGNLGEILSNRRYIGNNPAEPEPSIEVNFDNRILSNTPPILEQFLGENWREEI